MCFIKIGKYEKKNEIKFSSEDKLIEASLNLKIDVWF